jgi:hypothetical protein
VVNRPIASRATPNTAPDFLPGFQFAARAREFDPLLGELLCRIEMTEGAQNRVLEKVADLLSANLSNLPERALASVTPAWVAHRVCPMPTLPWGGTFETSWVKQEIRPVHLRSSILLFTSVAIPAESYPRYSRRRNSSIRIGVASELPMYPMIPHIRLNSLEGKSAPFLGKEWSSFLCKRGYLMNFCSR